MAQQLIIGTDVKQQFNLRLDNGENISIVIQYIPIYQGWYLISFTYKEITRTLNSRITLNISLLGQYYNIIPFGLYCASNDGIEPSYVDDFTSDIEDGERCSLYLLSKSEVLEVEKAYYKAD